MADQGGQDAPNGKPGLSRNTLIGIVVVGVGLAIVVGVTVCFGIGYVIAQALVP